MNKAELKHRHPEATAKELSVLWVYLNNNNIQDTRREVKMSYPKVSAILHKYGAIRSQAQARQLGHNNRGKAMSELDKAIASEARYGFLVHGFMDKWLKTKALPTSA
ncbi:hypothetical protein D5018_03775 [Parashewanella curva]|uniref:Uncharacterized protein n=1 Tax=Parashewanella curva TaxID=2338552 RepID=A0A3L8Q0L1_9GAMM|nr:hypothetical protein [Parashewanella curva]RLV60970.1 hypothetical protein D5018_03775 [Parashewanella curva]